MDMHAGRMPRSPCFRSSRARTGNIASILFIYGQYLSILRLLATSVLMDRDEVIGFRPACEARVAPLDPYPTASLPGEAVVGDRRREG